MTEPDEHGHLVHTNHYVCDRCCRTRATPPTRSAAAVRYERGRELLAEAPPGP